jgi:hypothetical protein
MGLLNTAIEKLGAQWDSIRDDLEAAFLQYQRKLSTKSTSKLIPLEEFKVRQRL